MVDQMPDKAALIQEYQICSTRADFLTSIAWQTFTLFLSLSAVGLGFLAQTNVQSFQQLILVAFFSLGVVWTLDWWNQVANKWNQQQGALYDRLDELEPILGFNTNRAIGGIDNRTPKPPKISNLRNTLILGVSLGWSLYLFIISLLIIIQLTNSKPPLSNIDQITLPIAYATCGLALVLILRVVRRIWKFSRRSAKI